METRQKLKMIDANENETIWSVSNYEINDIHLVDTCSILWMNIFFRLKTFAEEP